MWYRIFIAIFISLILTDLRVIEIILKKYFKIFEASKPEVRNIFTITSHFYK